MENLPEWLFPLIFAAVYFFGNMLSKKGGEDASGQPERPARRFAQEDPDAEERQRRVQEEIRRKIMERRQAASGEAATPSPVAEDLRRRREEVHARLEQRKEQREDAREVVTAPPVVPAPAPAKPEPARARDVSETEVSDSFSWDTSDNIYEKGMQARLKQIEATKRQADQLQKQAGGSGPAFPKARAARTARTTAVAPHATASVLRTLRNPRAARTAFIYGEVLGRPLGLRKTGSSDVPGMG